MQQKARNLKFVVIVGYIVVIVLSGWGIIWIYNEFVKFSDEDHSYEQRKELLMIGNTLAKMYQAESTIGLMSIDESLPLQREYSLLMDTIFTQIDTLKKFSKDPNLLTHIDSLDILLLRKKHSMEELIALRSYFENTTMKEITKTTVLSPKYKDDLSDLLKNIQEEHRDTNKIVGEKKGFFRRIQNAIAAQQDTLLDISSSSSSRTENLLIPIITDTISEFIQKVNKRSLLKKSAKVAQIVQWQNELYTINGQTIA
ncbi:MAG: hypothetical protein LBN18_04395, partial [Dysgonamonadaceae bacterium]|nr:hypothetical protein [Dysgonamonadaceae bacterium]